MKKLLQRRFPTYLSGFLVGLVAVVIILQLKKATAPKFRAVEDQRKTREINVGGMVRLQMGEEPGKYLAWGFPTQLALGWKGADGRFSPVARLEYRELVEKEVLIGPLKDVGEYELIASFYACAYPGEKYCARLNLRQAFQARENGGPTEVAIAVDLKTAADQAAQAGQTAGASTK